MGLLGRIYNIAKANALYRLDDMVSRSRLEDKFSDYMENLHRYRRNAESDTFDDTFDTGGEREWESTGTGRSEDTGFDYGLPRQVVEDLAVFGLKPPSNLEEIKSARNREIKKVHPDKFMNDPEKLEYAKQIMQTYNAAYDRLKAHYKGK